MFSVLRCGDSSEDFSEAMLKYFFKYHIYFMQPSTTDQKQQLRVSQFIGKTFKVFIAYRGQILLFSFCLKRHYAQCYHNDLSLRLYSTTMMWDPNITTLVEQVSNSITIKWYKLWDLLIFTNMIRVWDFILYYDTNLRPF